MPRRKAAAATEAIPAEAEAVLNLSESAADSSESTPRRRRRSSKAKAIDVNPELLQATHNKVMEFAYAASLAMPQDKRPTVDELNNTLLPIERIGIRHMPKPLQNADPDTRDAFEALGNFALYTARAFLFPFIGRLIAKQQRLTPQGEAPVSTRQQQEAQPIPEAVLQQQRMQRERATRLRDNVQLPTSSVPAQKAAAMKPEDVPAELKGIVTGNETTSPSSKLTPAIREALDSSKEPTQQLADLHKALSAGTPHIPGNG